MSVEALKYHDTLACSLRGKKGKFKDTCLDYWEEKEDEEAAVQVI